MNRKDLKKTVDIPKYNWRYPSNWIRIIRSFFKEIKFAIQRSKYGVSQADCWSLDFYLFKVLDNALAIFNDEKISYPSHLTMEEWTNVISHMRDLLTDIQVEGIDSYEANKLQGKGKNKEWVEAIRNWELHRQECLDELLDLLKEYMFQLWW